MNELMSKAESIHLMPARYGVKSAIYKNNQFRERSFPFDAIPGVVIKVEEL